MAQLVLDGKVLGVHPFFVQLRSMTDHTPLEGVVIGDIGPKLGFNSTDNGFCRCGCGVDGEAEEGRERALISIFPSCCPSPPPPCSVFVLLVLMSFLMPLPPLLVLQVLALAWFLPLPPRFSLFCPFWCRVRSSRLENSTATIAE